MNQIIKSSLVLLFFSASIVLFNISCEKEAEAQTQTTTTTPQNLGLILFAKDGDKYNEIWVAKYDGTAQAKITIASVPTDADIDRSTMKISPDGKKLFFNMYSASSGSVQNLYSCNVDGTGLTKIISNSDELCAVI